MENPKWRLLHLHRSRGVTRPLIRAMLQKDPTLRNLYHLSPPQLTHYFSLQPPRASKLYADLHDQKIISSLVNDLKTSHVLTIFDPYYPPLLKLIKDPPYVLYFMGNHKLLKQLPSLSVIGTRHPTNEAGQKMKRIIQPLVEKGWIIVSGMARGIDGYAHRLALESSGKTIAVMGSGFNYVYPPEHKAMFEQLSASQLVLSEYPPNSPPQKYYFPERNRIISGLSFATIVVEAKQKSGSLITVDQALDQGREVYAVPGSPLHEQTSGCHKMIQDGAKLVQNTQDIMEDWDDLKDKWCRIMS